MEQKDKAPPQGQQLPWWQLSLLGVACTVGTGFFLGSNIQLARMTAEHTLEGSFRSYAQKAYGRWAGFSSGWVYWSSELLIMGSQLAALSLFTRFWLSSLPMWCFAAGYGALGLLVIIWGTKGFERLENTLAVMKMAAILMFLVIAGLWSALIFSFYAFDGIEVIGLLTTRLKKPKDAPKAGKVMLAALTVLYISCPLASSCCWSPGPPMRQTKARLLFR